MDYEHEHFKLASKMLLTSLDKLRGDVNAHLLDMDEIQLLTSVVGYIIRKVHERG
jgi:hypothetical protein